MLTKQQQTKADERFKQLCATYATTRSKAVWDEMWMLVVQAAESCVKSMLKGVTVKDIDEMILDTAISAMERIKKEFDTTGKFDLEYKLVTFCRSYALYPLYKPSKQFNDQVLSLESYLENHSEAEIENIKPRTRGGKK